MNGVSKYSLPEEYRKYEAWLRRLRHNYECLLMQDLHEEGFTCNCLYWSKNKPLIDFWNCNYCVHKVWYKVFLDGR